MAKTLLSIFTTLIVSGMFLPTAYADTVHSIMRLDSAKPYTPTTGTVCAQPATVGTEADVQVTFPTGTTLGAAATFVVSTTNLSWPTGAVAWPSIATATNVTGQVVTFPSGDLTVGTLYCFNWTNSAAVTFSYKPLSSKNIVQITTRTGAGVPVDVQKVGFSSSNTTIGVTATINPRPTDLQLFYEADVPDNALLQKGDRIRITFTLQNNLPYAVPAFARLDWQKALLRGMNGEGDAYITGFLYTPTTLSYEIGNAYIQEQNNAIEWSIDSLPGGAKKRLILELGANADIPLGRIATTEIKASWYTKKVLLGEFKTQYRFHHPYPISPTPTPRSITAQKPTTANRFSLINLTTTEISDTQIQWKASTNTASNYIVLCGKTIETIAQLQKSSNYKLEQTITISDLEPETVYFCKLIFSAANGEQIQSDIYNITTATSIHKLSLTNDEFNLQYKDILLNGSSVKNIIIGTNKKTLATVRINNSTKQPKKITVRWINSKVLGVTDGFGEDNIAYESELLEVVPKIFSGHILTPQNPGIYKLLAKVEEYNGAFYEIESPFTVNTSDPIIVISQSGKPVEFARVEIQTKNIDTNLLNSLEKTLSIDKYTNEKGELDIALPEGTYTLIVSAPQYETKEEEIVISNTKSDYAPIVLKPHITLQGIFNYYANALYLVTNFSKNSIEALLKSSLFQDLLWLCVAIVFGILLAYILKKKLSEHIINHHKKHDLALHYFRMYSILFQVLTVLFIFLIVLFYQLPK